MSATRGAWAVATAIGAVEALKDQGICRWNYTFRSLHQRAKNNARLFSQVKVLSSSPASSESVSEKLERSEKSMRKVMDLSCWGPNTVRF
ncbi:hypothetical protein SLE2022_016980 [Rubroshorea leprosula]|uniref:Wound-responsive family protein n=1 Tax=Rubroshorea leprosula TaxID=152421 RepID=A0AAV5JWT7_9ROSI|nr:hypothetical protein SLEP1_g26598 [Rubroshorea leprosula]